MSKLLVTFSILLGIPLCMAAGCGGDDSAPKNKGSEDVSSKPLDADPAKAFIAGIEGYNKRDLALLFRMYPTDMMWLNMTALSEPIRGRRAFARQLVLERNAFPDCKVGLQRVIVDGNNLIAQGVFKGTHKGMVSTFKATGREVSYNILYFVEMEKGFAKRNITYYNLATLLRQIGAIKVSQVAKPTWPGKVEVVRGAPSSPSNQDLVRKFHEYWKEGDLDRLSEIVATDFVINNRATIESFSGLDDTKRYMKDERLVFKGLNFGTEYMTSVGAYVAVLMKKRGDYRMKVKEDQDPVEKSVEIPCAHVFQVKAGKLASLDIYFDELYMHKQFQVAPHIALKLMSENEGEGDKKENTESASEDVEPGEEPKAPDTSQAPPSPASAKKPEAESQK